MREGRAAKGDVLAVARVAAIQGAKRTAELIPLCHPLPLAGVAVAIEPAAEAPACAWWPARAPPPPPAWRWKPSPPCRWACSPSTTCSRPADPAMTIGPVRLLEKHGGRHGSWRHPELLRPRPRRQAEHRPMAEPFPREGLPLEEARARVLAALTPLAGPGTAAAGRLPGPGERREPAAPAEAVPGFRASIMDGYAIADAAPPPGGALAAGGPLRPGRSLRRARWQPGEAIRILTGAPLPEAAARVLPQELVAAGGGHPAPERRGRRQPLDPRRR